MTSGVYAIVNTVDGMAYVGSSRNVEKRWSGRRSELEQGTSVNKALQAAWLASNGEGFEFQVLEQVDGDENDLTAAEQRWLDSYADRCYNVRMRVWRATFGSLLPRLRETRLAAGLTIRGLSERAGVGPNTVWKAEHGHRVHAATSQRIAAALRVDTIKLRSQEDEDRTIQWQADWKRRNRRRTTQIRKRWDARYGSAERRRSSPRAPRPGEGAE